MERKIVAANEVASNLFVRPDDYIYDSFKLYKSLAVASYVHGYSICIEYFTKWFKEKFRPDYFRGGIYIDGSHVIDEYKKFDSKIPVKRENPRARIIPTLDNDFDRDDIDNYLGNPNIYLRRSRYQDSFFKDYDKRLFLSMQLKALKMNFNTKIRVNTRAEQLDLWNYMQLAFRNMTTQYEYISVDFHVPKALILSIAERAGFEIKNGNIVDIISFLNYFNQHSDIVLLFKIRAINKQPEFFIRIVDLYTHIACKDKLSRDDGEKDGKLDFNFHVEMENIVTMPVPAFYIYCDQQEIQMPLNLENMEQDMVALYSINIIDIPPVNERGWNQAAITSYMTDIDEEELDLSSIFTGDNILTRAINHDLTLGVSPDHFIDIKIYRDHDVAKIVPMKMDWNTKKAILKNKTECEEEYQIVMYYDRDYIHTLDSELNKYNDTRIN